MSEKYSTFQQAPAPYPVEGVGHSSFSSRNMYVTIFAFPLLVQMIMGLSFYYYPLLLVLVSIPSFAAFQIMSSKINTPLRPQAGLPGKPIGHYLSLKGLKSKYTKKIPMETFFESYFDGDIDLHEGADLLEVLEARYDWAAFEFTLNQAKFFISQWVPETLWHSRKQDEDQVRDHYDRGDDFYNWFLGPMMIYTSGIMSSANKRESLEVLQQRKLQTVTDKIGLVPGDKMLDIGCGWGTLSVHAATKGADVTGVTLGLNQTEWAMGRAAQAGVADKVRILCMDYRDIPDEKYNKITCLEMAEHVGVLRFTTFLQQVREMLEDDGLFFLQIAGLRRAWQYEDLQWGVIYF
jgi:2-polyprenyl-3-methyl-5-hydroxy-6-metoxy-1,4-benzoquinol methylase